MTEERPAWVQVAASLRAQAGSWRRLTPEQVEDLRSQDAGVATVLGSIERGGWIDEADDLYLDEAAYTYLESQP